jgi:proline iminopeptidase
MRLPPCNSGHRCTDGGFGECSQAQGHYGRHLCRSCLTFFSGGESLRPESAAGTSDRVPQPTPSRKRESILDRQVHLEEELITAIPAVQRWCSKLSLNRRKINVGDCELYLEEEGRGIPLVLINGGPGGTHHCFHPWFSRAEDFARVIYYDQRGCGLSDHMPGQDGYSVDQAVADLDALRQALEIDQWVVLGYSYGGLLAQYYAMKHVESLSGLILLGAAPGMWAEMKPGRQWDFLTEEEQARMRENQSRLQALAMKEEWPEEKSESLVLYNNHLNGDWKRQHFYKPSREQMARNALYEWNFDLRNNFRGAIGNSMNRIDMTGAFAGFPVPTLILDGRWDLTWNTDKPGILAKNHPAAKQVIFENAGHSIYDEDPDKFFRVVAGFVRSLPPVSQAEIAAYRNYLVNWDRMQKASPLHITRTAGDGRSAMLGLAEAYKREWCDELDDLFSLLKVGFAQYEAARYDEALYIYERMQEEAERQERPPLQALALVWQGHMLDLLGRRPQAITRYRQAADKNLKASWRHNNYGLDYELPAYAQERMERPFIRVENCQD